MSFTGDLEHLPIVDVIQLLHATRKSGTLDVKGRRGVCQLVFREGYIVSASHARSNVRIGQILVELKALNSETLEQALSEQKSAGESRKPLVATLIEGGHIRKEDAFKGLETLIEMTVVEILTWPGGTFSLEVDQITVADEYRYLPEKLNQDFNVNTQNVLMDALRIYDEKKRDGELEDDFPEEEGFAEPLTAAAAARASLSAADLGLDDLDSLEKRIPGVFSGLAAVPVDIHQQKVKEIAPGLSAAAQEDLGAFLQRSAGPAGAEPTARAAAANPPVILFSQDELLRYALSTVFKPAGILVFATNDERDLGPIIEQSLAKNTVPFLIFDRPEVSAASPSEETLIELRRQKKTRYPHLPVIQLASPRDYSFSLQSFKEGVRTVFPRPLQEERQETFVADLVEFLESFRSYLLACAGEQENWVGGLRSGLAGFRDLREAPEAARILLQFTAQIFPRSLTLVVGSDELIAEEAVGIESVPEGAAETAVDIQHSAVAAVGFQPGDRGGASVLRPEPGSDIERSSFRRHRRTPALHHSPAAVEEQRQDSFPHLCRFRVARGFTRPARSAGNHGRAGGIDRGEFLLS